MTLPEKLEALTGRVVELSFTQYLRFSTLDALQAIEIPQDTDPLGALDSAIRGNTLHLLHLSC